MKLDANTHFYVVWDKKTMLPPSGDANFKYGAPRPQDERERTSLFFGRPQGTDGRPQVFTVKAVVLRQQTGNTLPLHHLLFP